jgi:hypothetical protein
MSYSYYTTMISKVHFECDTRNLKIRNPGLARLTILSFYLCENFPDFLNNLDPSITIY